MTNLLMIRGIVIVINRNHRLGNFFRITLMLLSVVCPLLMLHLASRILSTRVLQMLTKKNLEETVMFLEKLFKYSLRWETGYCITWSLTRDNQLPLDIDSSS